MAVLDEQEIDGVDLPVIVEDMEAEVLNEIEIPEDLYTAIRDGLVGVTQSGEGTAVDAFEGFDPNFQVAGKTGTAQVASQENGNALFTSYGPVNSPFGPRYAVTAIIENTPLYGGQVAAPLVRSIYDILALPAPPQAQTADAALGTEDEPVPTEMPGQAAPG
jgi:cell division protein FtsI/penicillin-binding protein 2